MNNSQYDKLISTIKNAKPNLAFIQWVIGWGITIGFIPIDPLLGFANILKALAGYFILWPILFGAQLLELLQ